MQLMCVIILIIIITIITFILITIITCIVVIINTALVIIIITIIIIEPVSYSKVSSFYEYRAKSCCQLKGISSYVSQQNKNLHHHMTFD